MEYVYRMENAQGRGPYDSIVDPLSWTEEEHVPETGRPDPGEDDLMDAFYAMGEHGTVLFACPTLSAAQTWFTAIERYNLALRGYLIKRVPVKEIVVEDDIYPAMVIGKSERQCIFIRGEEVKKK